MSTVQRSSTGQVEVKWRHSGTQGGTRDISPNWWDSSLTLVNVTMADSGSYYPLAIASKLADPVWKNAVGRTYEVHVERGEPELFSINIFYVTHEICMLFFSCMPIIDNQRNVLNRTTCPYDHTTGMCKCTETTSPTPVLEGIIGT